MDEYYKQLLEYLQQTLAQGYSEESIRAVFNQRHVSPEIVDKLFLETQKPARTEAPAPRNRMYPIFAKLGTISAVIAIIFLVRTTGALQQNAIATTTQTHEPAATTPKTTSSQSSTPQSPQTTTTTTTQAPTTEIPPATTPAPSQSVAPTAPTASSTPAPVTTPSPSPTPIPAPTPTPTPTYTYKNGTYTAIGSFSTPAGTEKISITLVVADDVVTDTSAVNMATNSTSINYCNIFINNYKPQVVGKSLKTLDLSKVSSASLTPIGFNNAADMIRSQAS